MRQPKRRHQLKIDRDRTQISLPIRQAIRMATKGETPWPIYLGGTAGIGKTCAGLCLVDCVEDPAKFYSLRDWTERCQMAKLGKLLSTGQCPVPLTMQDMEKEVEQANLFVLDEIGQRDNPSDFEREVFQMVLDKRRFKPMLVIGNLDAPEIMMVYGERILSRLRAGQIIFLEGEDRRLTENPTTQAPVLNAKADAEKTKEDLREQKWLQIQNQAK